MGRWAPPKGRAATAPPDAYLEDPHDLPGIAERVGDHLERVSYNAPIRGPEDIGATPLSGRVVNVKPSRIGGLRGDRRGDGAERRRSGRGLDAIRALQAP